MPMYSYRYTDAEGGEFDDFQRMADAAHTTYNDRPCERTVQKASVRTQYGAGSGTDPIEMMSIALDNEGDIAEFRKRNPGTEISSDRRDRNFGVPIARSRSEKLRVLAMEGFVETN